MAEPNAPLTFTVRRRTPELIGPAQPTPRELKPLSDIDDQEILRCQVLDIQIYRGDPKIRSKNPASVIREALAKLLVFYYPFAGRLKEGPASKLMVDCTSEGVLFIEAEADVTLDQFGDALQPPFPCMEELLYDVPGSGGILDSPLLLIQVTQLLCGGFILALRLNHTMSDAAGLVQFLFGLAEIARGATSPSILPVWQRELLCSSDRLREPFTHREYNDQVAYTKGTIMPLDHMVHKSLFLTTKDISAIRRLVPTHLKNCSTFEVLTAFLWRCRTIALQRGPEDEMPIIWAIDARKMFNPPVPAGYYGNVFTMLIAISTARDLCNKPLGYALELVMKAKHGVTKDYTRSVSSLMAIKRWIHLTDVRPYVVSDLTRARFDAVDFGWGKAAYGGAAKGGRLGLIPGLTSFYVTYKNNNGESGIVIPMCLPSVSAMDIFVDEVHNMLAQGKNDEVLVEHKSHTRSRI